MKISNLILTSTITTSLIFGLSGCASKPSSLKAKEVPSNEQTKYNKYNCTQIENKLYFLKKKERKLRKEQNDIVRSEPPLTTLMILGIITIPLIPILNGDGETAENYKLTKGKLEYIEELSIEKSCNINVNKSNIEVEYN